MIRRILIPTDGSPASELAMPIAERLARAQGAEVLLLQVIRYPVVYDGFGVGPDVYQMMLDASKDQAEANLGRLEAQFRDQGVRTKSLLLRGSPAACLLDVERDEEVDMVVMSTHGRTGLARFALGSVADRIVREGARPVITVPPTTSPSNLDSALLMLDGSDVAEEAVAVLEDLAIRPIKSIKLFRAVDDTSERTAARTYLEGASYRLAAAGFQTEIAVHLGDPISLVRRAAEDMDLVVLCTHG